MVVVYCFLAKIFCRSSTNLLLLFSGSVTSNLLWPHRLQHTRPPCPSPSPGVCPSSCPLHWWYHLAISSSDAIYSFCLQSFPASGTFPMSWLFASGDQSTRASAASSVIQMSIQGWFPLRETGLISLLSKELSGVFSSTTVQRNKFFGSLPSLRSSSHWEDHSLYLTTGKAIALTIGTFVGRVMSLLFNTLSRLVLTFLPTRNHLLISWLQSPSAAILEPKKKKLVTASTFSPYICYKVIGSDAMILVFIMFSFKPAFSLSSFTLIKKFFSSCLLSAI